MKKMAITVVAVCVALGMRVPVMAASPDMMVEVNGVIFDVEELAEKNHVDPEALRANILSGKNSPYSDLPSTIPNTSAREYVESSIARAQTKVTKSDQDCTAYDSNPGDKTASSKIPTLGMCAMKIASTTKTGSTTSSKVKLGTTIYLDSSVNVLGTNYDTFVVEDRGSGGGRTDFWIDIYFGLKDNVHQDAIDFGVKKVTYCYYY